MENIYVKIYAKNDHILVLETRGKKKVEGILYPSGKFTYMEKGVKKQSFQIAPFVVGEEHIAISKEAIALFKEIVTKSKHTGDDTSDLEIFSSGMEENKKVCLSWFGYNKRSINTHKLMDIIIGCGEGAPQLDLLDKLVIKDNTFLQNYQFTEEKTLENDDENERSL